MRIPFSGSVRPRRGLTVAALVTAGTAPLTFAGGGYAPSSWGWALLFWMMAALGSVLLVDRPSLGRRETVLAGLLLVWATWAGISAVWSESVPLALLDAQRGLVVAAAALAVSLVATAEDGPWVATGLFTTAVGVCAWALLVHFVPDGVGRGIPDPTSRLAGPVGYANALGLVATMGICTGLALVLAIRRRVVTAVVLSTMPLLSAALYLTFSRGAWLALGAGLLTPLLIGVDPRLTGLRIVQLALPLGIGALVARSGYVALASHRPTAGTVLETGHWTGGALLAACVASALVAKTPWLHTDGSSGSWTKWRLALAAGVVAGGLAALTVAMHAGQLGARLDATTVSGRDAFWRVAIDMSARHPLLGTGSGTYFFEWLRERHTGFTVHSAHSLFLETLGELGPLGLLAAIGMVAVPLAVRRRRASSAAAAAGAFVAFAVHAAADWDWDMPGVATIGVLAGAASLIPLRATDDYRLQTSIRYGVAAALSIGLVLAATWVLSATALSRATDELLRGRFDRAVTSARAAERWAPWASAPLSVRAAAQHALGRRSSALSSLYEAIRRDPRNPGLWRQLAVTARGAECARARAVALRLDPYGGTIACSAANRDGRRDT